MKRKKCKKSRDTASLNKLNLLPDAGMAMSGIIKEKIGYLGNFSLGIASALIAMFYAAVFLKVRICSCLSTQPQHLLFLGIAFALIAMFYAAIFLR